MYNLLPLVVSTPGHRVTGWRAESMPHFRIWEHTTLIKDCHHIFFCFVDCNYCFLSVICVCCVSPNCFPVVSLKLVNCLISKRTCPLTCLASSPLFCLDGISVFFWDSPIFGFPDHFLSLFLAQSCLFISRFFRRFASFQNFASLWIAALCSDHIWAWPGGGRFRMTHKVFIPPNPS